MVPVSLTLFLYIRKRKKKNFLFLTYTDTHKLDSFTQYTVHTSHMFPIYVIYKHNTTPHPAHTSNQAAALSAFFFFSLGPIPFSFPSLLFTFHFVLFTSTPSSRITAVESIKRSKLGGKSWIGRNVHRMGQLVCSHKYII